MHIVPDTAASRIEVLQPAGINSGVVLPGVYVAEQLPYILVSTVEAQEIGYDDKHEKFSTFVWPCY